MRNGYFDIHSHVLWGIDDGAREFDESVDLCRMADDCGTGTLFLTPHLIYWENAEELFDTRNEKFEELFDVVRQLDLDLNLEKGFEILCDDDIFNIKYFKPYTLAGTRYILIEFDFFKTTESDVRSWCSYLKSFGLVPIIAHPERYAFMLSDGACVDRLSEDGVLFQINCGSPAGMFGSNSRDFSLRMLDRGFADFIGSDAHALRSRNTDLEYCFSFYPNEISTRLLDIACFENPEKLLKDEQITPNRFCYFAEN